MKLYIKAPKMYNSMLPSGEKVTGPCLNDMEHCNGDYRTPDKVVSGTLVF